MDIKYVFKRLMDMNYRSFFNKLDSLQKLTGKSKAFLLGDMMVCAIKYGAGYMDYDLFEMYNLTPSERDTYLTRGRNNALVKKYNDPKYVSCFDDKTLFMRIFSEYLHREWISTTDPQDRVLSFITGRDTFIAKPAEGSCGMGVERINTKDYPDALHIYRKLLAYGKPYLLEDVIEQHPLLNAIYPESVNTVRAVTINNGGIVRIACTYFRIGNTNGCVDNFNNGGMVVPVDEKTGTVRCNAVDKNKKSYDIHPTSGAKIAGFVFPDWEKAMQIVCCAAKEVPQVGYIGWDVAFTPNGPCLVEGNNFPGHDIYQLPAQTGDKRGIYERFLV